jgi:hypothetical protein
MVCIFDPACELLPPWTKALYDTCVLLPLYCTFSLTSSPTSQCTVYRVQGAWRGLEHGTFLAASMRANYVYLGMPKAEYFNIKFKDL